MAKTHSNESAEETEQISESYISIGLGLLVVVVVGILLYNYFTQKENKPSASPSSEVTQEATSAAKPGNKYTVAAGDTLWSISEKAYGTGYNWPDIAKANKLSSGSTLEAGTVLTIPDVTPVMIAQSPSPAASVMAQATLEPSIAPSPNVVMSSPTASPQVAPAATAPQTISGEAYTVTHGDTLWSIACRAYNDCYAWTKIAQANKLTNPDLIFSGNELRLPR